MGKFCLLLFLNITGFLIERSIAFQIFSGHFPDEEAILRSRRVEWGSGCVLDNVEIKISSRIDQSSSLRILLTSLKLLLPCFVRINLIVPDEQILIFHDFLYNDFLKNQHFPLFLDQSDLALIVLIPEKVPKFILDMGSFYRSAYHDFVLDKLELKRSTEYVLVLDSDTQAVIPLLCQSLFDEYGRGSFLSFMIYAMLFLWVSLIVYTWR